MESPLAASQLRKRGAVSASRRARLVATLATILFSLPAQAGITLNFAGAGTVGASCTLSGTVYTCTSLPIASDDKIVIASGYAVEITGNLTLTDNNGLKMSGSARLKTTGNLDISGLPMPKLDVTGGTLEADATYKMGNRDQTLTANIKAANMVLGGGNDIKITGTVYSTGTISIGSNATIIGDVTSVNGNINTNPPLIINGNVSATKGSFEVPSKSTVTGNVAAQDVKLLPSPSKVIGNVNATNSLEIGSGSGVQGNVTAKTAVLYSANAYVTGTAAVDSITLGTNGTIQQGITCNTGNCNCVTNGSGLPAQCTPATAAAHHLRLNHTGNGLTCTPSSVTVTACSTADAGGTCTAKTGAVTGNVIALAGSTPVATVPFSIPAAGSSVTVSVPVTTPQNVTFSVGGVSVTPTYPATCWNGSSANCTHTYADSELQFDIPNHYAGSSQSITIKALKKGGGQTCVPAFVGSRNIKFTCAYGNPVAAQVTQAPTVGGTSMGSAGGKCDAAGGVVALTFDNNGSAPATVSYPDVGQLTVTATDVQTNVTGSDSFIAAPKSLVLTASASTVAAGTPYSFEFTAKNTANAVTPAFGKETSPIAMDLATQRCTPTAAGSLNGVSTPGSISYLNGVGSASVSWTETGTANVKVELSTTAPSTGYLGSGLGASVTSSGCPLASIPHHFDTEITTAQYWYSGQPQADIKITAREAGGGTTSNYFKGGTANIDLAAWNAGSTAAIAPTMGTLSITTVASSSFTNGVATIRPKFTFANDLTAPLDIRVRARGQHMAQKNNAGAEALLTIRKGRLRLSNAFGSSANVDLQMNVVAEYWTGLSWFPNASDFSLIPTSAIALSNAPGNEYGPENIVKGGPIALSSGKGALVLKNPNKWRGSVDVALNLGNTTDDDVSCLPGHPDTTGADLIWLRSRNGCSSSYDKDPSARASFGKSTPESRATVHFREVFN